MRVVVGDDVSHLVQRAEPRFHPFGHERVDPARPGQVHIRHDVHQHHCAGNARRELPRQQHRGKPTQGGAHQRRLPRQVAQHFLDIAGEADQPIVAFARPVGFAMPAQIDRDRLPATFGDSGCGPTP